MTFHKDDNKDTQKEKNSQRSEEIRKILIFVKLHIRYFAAGALLFLLILVLAMCAAPGKRSAEDAAATELSETAEPESFALNAYPEINDLITQYYTAYAAGDLTSLSALATPIAANEQTYIAMFSQYVEAYQNIQCYTKSGLDASSYMVYVSMEIKFNGVDTAAPGLEFFYVRTNDDGALYIDNLYSPYNLANKENALDTSVQSLLQELINEDDAIALQEETQQNYETAIASDENLATMVNTTIPTEIAAWKDSVVALANQATTEETTEAATEEETTETTTEEITQPAEENTAEGDDTTEGDDTAQEEITTTTMYTTDKVNVRASADTSSEKLTTLESGTAVEATGTEGDWTAITYNGTSGYVKTEYLTADEPTAESEGTADSNGIAEGTVITLEDSVNIRSAMSETADRIGTAYPGEKVTVVMSYSEGWTKVTWNGETGYVKTSLLQ